MRHISRVFDTLEQAERFQMRLYNLYYYVKLIRFPYFSEDGTYVWRVIK